MIRLIKQLFIVIALMLTALAAYAQAIDLNTATAKELEALKGVGAKRAEAIVKYRTEHGAFQSADDLAKVPGIGPKIGTKILSDNKDKLTVGKAAQPTAPAAPPAMGTTPTPTPTPPAKGTTKP
jgi:competence protein ComEA